MGCSACGTDNPAGARFCNGCGTALLAVCAGCSHENPPGSRFCNACGLALTATARPGAPIPVPAAQSRASADALEGERKQVTILFADVVSSTALIESLDEEEAQRLLDGVVQRMVEAVQRYEGTVSRKMGDGLMALFGAPVAHEDHAVRACYAALAMLESAQRYAEDARRTNGAALQIRVGLNSGGVIVRDLSDDRHRDYTAMGPTVHLAARMEQLAAPGMALMPAATLALVEGYVDSRPIGTREVRGFDLPVEVYEVVGAGAARTRFQATAARGLTPFVGRDEEQAAIDRALARARAGQGQVVALVADAGVGKSRLVWEATRSDRADGSRVLQTGALSYGQTTAWLPVIDLLRTYFQIESRDDHAAMRDRVLAGLRALDPALDATAPALLALLDVPVEDAAWAERDPAQRRRATLDAVRQLLLRESLRQPLLLVFEDLHWIDAETQALLDSLVEALPPARILLLVNYRPEYTHGWGNKSYYTQLRLDPLADQNAEELLSGLLGSDSSIRPLTALLVQRTEGTPLFLEESVRSLVETGALVGERGAYRLAQPVAEIRVPATVQTVLAARIDRLEPEEKRLLQTAAVIGKDVPFALLQAIAERPEAELQAGIGRLQAGELLYPTSRFPEPEYTFKHALTHDVAYGSLLQERRKRLHARIVAAIEAEYGERLDEHVERLAHHAVHGELREKAVHYLRQAGQKAAARWALPDARVWFEQALVVLEALPEDQGTLQQAFEIRLELRPALFLLGEVRQTLERMREAAALAERLNDNRRRGQVYALMALTHARLGELPEALESGTRALHIAGHLGDLRLRVLTASTLQQVRYFRGEYGRVVELATDNLAALPADWIHQRFGHAAPPATHDRAYLVLSLAELGRFSEAAEHAAEAIRLAEPTGDAFSLGLVQRAAGALHLLRGDWAKARALLERGIAAVGTVNVEGFISWRIGYAGWVLAQLGQRSEALARVQEGERFLDHQEARGVVGHAGWNLHALGRACLLLGRLDQARLLAECVIESVPAQAGFVAHALHLLGDVATHPDRFDAESGEDHYRQALTLAEKSEMRPLQARCHLGLGKLYRRIGRVDEARSELARAVEMLREMGMAFWLPEAGAELKSASSASVD